MTGERITLYLGFGSNLGNRVAAIRTGVRSLLADGLEPEAFSSLYHSRARYVEQQPPFVNCVGRFRTDKDPAGVLAACRRAEAAAGRRPRQRHGPRELDVDLLLYGRIRVDAPDLQVPHPGLAERLFVLVPLAELDPTVRVPDSEEVRVLLERALADQPVENRVVSLGSFIPERGRPLDGSPV